MACEYVAPGLPAEVRALFDELRRRLREVAAEHWLLDEQVVVSGRELTVEEAIGCPKRQDFPLKKGKEKLLQASFSGSFGQAFTDQGGYFRGTLEEIIDLPLESHFDMAVFVATLNAVMRHLGLAERTVHCRDEEPEECAVQLVSFVKEQYGKPKVALVGLQPALMEKLASSFPLRVLDLNPDQIGTTKYDVRIEDGEKDMNEVLQWCDLILATGSTLVNGTILNYVNAGKPVVFYGTTLAGAAPLLGLNRFCACGK